MESKAGGGHDAFLTAPLHLRRDVTLVIDKGAVLFGSRNPRDYDRQPGVCGTITTRDHGCNALISGDHVANAGIMGDGIIDGRAGYKIIGQTKPGGSLRTRASRGRYKTVRG